MHYIMVRCNSFAAGAHKVWITRTRAEAERIAHRMDNPLNGQPLKKTFILSQYEYDDWYKNNVAMLNNKHRTVAELNKKDRNVVVLYNKNR